MNKYLYILLIILFFVITSSFLYYKLTKNFEASKNFEEQTEKNLNQDSQEKNLSKENTTSNKSLGKDSGKTTSETNTEITSNENNEKKLPEDLNSKPCGFYFKDYGVCTGTCPEGICVSEERSCYCKRL